MKVRVSQIVFLDADEERDNKAFGAALKETLTAAKFEHANVVVTSVESEEHRKVIERTMDDGTWFNVRAPSARVLDIAVHPFSALWSGHRTYEVQQDIGFCIGDLLDLREKQDEDPFSLKIEGRSGRRILARVVHKTSGGNFGLPLELCVLGLRILRTDEDVHDETEASNADRS